MADRDELKARMTAHLGFDAETASWISQTIARMPFVEIKEELEFFRSIQGA